MNLEELQLVVDMIGGLGGQALYGMIAFLATTILTECIKYSVGILAIMLVYKVVQRLITVANPPEE